jgi:hypothetical protein
VAKTAIESAFKGSNVPMHLALTLYLACTQTVEFLESGKVDDINRLFKVPENVAKTLIDK